MDLGVKFVPPKLAEVIDWGFLNGLPAHECEKFHAYYSSQGWKVGRNKMKSWRDALNHWKLVWAERRCGQPHHSVFEYKTIIEAKEKLCASLKNSGCRTVATGPQWVNENKRLEYVALKKEIRELTRQLASM